MFNRQFITVWITSVSLSLTMYAFYEKLSPSKTKAGRNNAEMEESKQLIEQIETLTGFAQCLSDAVNKNNGEEANQEAAVGESEAEAGSVLKLSAPEQSDNNSMKNKIILGKRNGEIKIDEIQA